MKYIDLSTYLFGEKHFTHRQTVFCIFSMPSSTDKAVFYLYLEKAFGEKGVSSINLQIPECSRYSDRRYSE
jgi:hypothetical protein